MEQLSDASSVDFYKQLQYWKTLFAEGLQHAASREHAAVMNTSTSAGCESEEKSRNAEDGGNSDTSTIVGEAEMAEAFENLSEWGWVKTWATRAVEETLKWGIRPINFPNNFLPARSLPQPMHRNCGGGAEEIDIFCQYRRTHVCACRSAHCSFRV
ncbi:hypothetical protein BBJ28_00026654 [Nothophytophthora sp. Chile5]|nr:hypothetical protein BBJ28_00026654 [Nothophytophthora sp. Chile5]